jgi:hypothetical protein
MNANQKDVSRGLWLFWLWWVLANALGFGVGAVLALSVSYVLFPRNTFDVVIGVSFGLLFGAVGGLAQWLVLRSRITEVSLWAPANALGFMLAASIAASMVQQVTFNSNALAFLFAALFGVTGGLMQWLILRRQGVTVEWWLPASLLGSLLGITLSIPAINAMRTGSYGITTLFGFGVAFGVGLSVTTGSALDWLLRHPKSAHSAEAASQGAR